MRDNSRAFVQSLTDAMKGKAISLAGIKPGQTSAEFKEPLQLPDVMLLASDLSKAGVSGSLRSVLALA